MDLKAYVTGASLPAGAGVVRLLRARGLKVVAAAAGFAEEEAPRGLPAPDDPSFAWSVSRILRERRIGLFVPTVDRELAELARARPEIEREGGRVAVAPLRAICAANDRWWSYETLRDAGVEVPRYVCGVARAAAASLLPIPAVSRPRLRGAPGGEVLHARLQDLPERLSTERVYCEHLPGERYEVDVFGGAGGAVLALQVVAGGDREPAEGVEADREADVALLARAACRAIGLEGPGCVEVRRDRRGRPRVTGLVVRPSEHLERSPAVAEAVLRAWTGAP